MKSLYDYKEELHKCSKCGLCQSVCPIYKEFKNECAVTRGQFILLDGVIKNKFKITNNINNYLDLCLKCNKCSDFCPSDINAFDILLAAKHEYFKNSISGKIYSILESKLFFNTAINTIGFITSIFHKKIKQKKLKYKAIYFDGCMGKISPDIKNYVIKILNSVGIEVINKNYNCCGIPFLTTGNLFRFKEQAEENIKKTDTDIDFFITDCASCEFAWQEYKKYIDNDELISKYNKINFKNLYEIIDEFEIKFYSKKLKKITYHLPCHEKHENNIINIINNCKNVEYVELDSKNECCGMASLEHPSTLKKIFSLLNKKSASLQNSKADEIITTCVGCLATLKILSLFKKKVNRLISFLKNNCEII